MLKRRELLLAAGAMPGLALAHHGWSRFDQDRPVYLEGRAATVRWQNPHAELTLEIAPGMQLPPDLARRPLPAQIAGLDGPALLAKATLPRRKDALWEVELAPLLRMRAWNVAEIRPGSPVAVLGFTFKEEQGDPVLRAEYLFVDGKAYGLRSSPA